MEAASFSFFQSTPCLSRAAMPLAGQRTFVHPSAASGLIDAVAREVDDRKVSSAAFGRVTKTSGGDVRLLCLFGAPRLRGSDRRSHLRDVPGIVRRMVAPWSFRENKPQSRGLPRVAYFLAGPILDCDAGRAASQVPPLREIHHAIAKCLASAPDRLRRRNRKNVQGFDIELPATNSTVRGSARDLDEHRLHCIIRARVVVSAGGFDGA